MTSVSFNDSQLDSVTVLFERKLLQRSNDSGGSYVFDCPYPILAQKYRVNSVMIPPTTYHVHAGNNKIAFTNNANGDIEATIESGFYDSREDLLAAVDTAMTAASAAAPGIDHTYVVVETPGTSATLGTINISQNSAEMIIFGSEHPKANENARPVSSAAELLGLGQLPVIVDAGATFTGPDVMRDDGPDFISVLSPTLSKNNSHSGKRSGNIVTLPFNAPGEAVFYNTENASFVDLEGPQPFRQFEIELRDSFDKPVILNGSSPAISITFAIESRKTR